ncbi:MAG TPA: putative Ig domain-containing protein, partial [Verrucomicrobiae bacterium]|nr:putative Ig domain-containing protein [Verrucomicrobiae bacterium]
NQADTLTFAKVSGPAWLSVAANGTLSGTASTSNVGTNTLLITVTDTGGLSSTGTVYLAVNGPPSFSSNPITVPGATAGQSYSATITGLVSDPNPGDVLTIRKVSGPAWLSVAGNGALSGAPAPADAGTNVFQVSVTDSGGLSNTAAMRVYVNAAPAFTQNPFSLTNATVGQAYASSIAGQATDPNVGDSLTFAKLSGPSWLSVASGGVISGSASAGDVGTNSFVVSVVDPGGLSNTATMNIVVLPKPAPLAVRAAVLGGQLSLTWDGGTAPFQVQAASGLSPAAWQDLAPATTNRSLLIPRTNAAAFYRVLGQ